MNGSQIGGVTNARLCIARHHLLGATALALVVAACGHDANAPPPAAPPVQVEVPPAKPESQPAPGAASTASTEGSKAAASTTAQSDSDHGQMPSPAASSSAPGAPDPALGRPKTSPSLRQGATTVTGKLPPELIQRLVRQNFGRFRLCYEKGLAKNVNLGGRVTVKFTIDTTGGVSHVVDGGSDLPDKDVVACVVQAFSNLSFPQPEGGGTVAVAYPIIFAPGTTK